MQLILPAVDVNAPDKAQKTTVPHKAAGKQHQQKIGVLPDSGDDLREIGNDGDQVQYLGPHQEPQNAIKGGEEQVHPVLPQALAAQHSHGNAKADADQGKDAVKGDGTTQKFKRR